jgi:hypothetical protein
VNLVFYALALVGTAHQLREVWRRRAAAPGAAPGVATAVISLNQLAVSFLGYYAFFVYGWCVRPFNHYLVWPRLAGLLLVLAILRELARDRRDPVSRGVFGTGVALLLPALVVLAVAPELGPEARLVPQVLAVVATVLLVQGFGHQILLVRRARAVGAVSTWMHVSTFVKDFSLAALGAAMGAAQGWPLILMGGASVAVKSVLIAHLWAYRPVEGSARTGRVGGADPQA